MRDIKKTSEQWCKELLSYTTILDPDGWDRSNFHYSWFEERITQKEFNNRLMNSTVSTLAELMGEK